MYAGQYIVVELKQWIDEVTHFNPDKDIHAKQLLTKINELDKQYNKPKEV